MTIIIQSSHAFCCCWRLPSIQMYQIVSKYIKNGKKINNLSGENAALIKRNNILLLLYVYFLCNFMFFRASFWLIKRPRFFFSFLVFCLFALFSFICLFLLPASCFANPVVSYLYFAITLALCAVHLMDWVIRVVSFFFVWYALLGYNRTGLSFLDVWHKFSKRIKLTMKLKHTVENNMRFKPGINRKWNVPFFLYGSEIWPTFVYGSVCVHVFGSILVQFCSKHYFWQLAG